MATHDVQFSQPVRVINDEESVGIEMSVCVIRTSKPGWFRAMLRKVFGKPRTREETIFYNISVDIPRSCIIREENDWCIRAG